MEISLKPTTATSFPTMKPMSRSAPMAPIAVMSLTAKIAVGGGPEVMIFLVAQWPAWASNPE